jgi:hypothetical protein
MHFALLVACLLFVKATSGHMQLSFPSPRGNPQDSQAAPADYNLNGPLSSTAMCKGKAPGQPLATLQAGQVVEVKFKGSARHNGGICQFALSYDNDRTFTLIQRIDGACPDENYGWSVKLPENLPGGERVTFAWTWINAVGNREYYMNCADVRIIGKPGHGIRGRPLMVANLPGFPQMHPAGATGGPANSKSKIYQVQAF